ncbi:50S ribosomal protein L22 [Candidatus Woesearchaeota archaeon]|nr:50S ribosomal protein L22 [Candidatus Woesearchaeota archaeon]
MKYTIKDIKENMAVAQSTGLPLSLKDSIIVSKYLKGKTTTRAKRDLEEVTNLKRVIPYTKFNSDRGHKRGTVAAGRFPVKAAKNFLMLIKSVEKNASAKGLNVENLVITNIIPNKGNVGYHYGRRRGLKTKSVHIQIYVEESSAKATKKVAKKTADKKETKEVSDEKKVAKKTTKKVVEKSESKPKEEVVKND